VFSVPRTHWGNPRRACLNDSQANRSYGASSSACLIIPTHGDHPFRCVQRISIKSPYLCVPCCFRFSHATMTTYPTDGDEVAMVHTTPVQGKLQVDGSSAHESLADALVEGSEDVTHAEFNNLRHIPDSLPLSSFLVVTVEFAERFSYHG